MKLLAFPDYSVVRLTEVWAVCTYVPLFGGHGTEAMCTQEVLSEVTKGTVKWDREHCCHSHRRMLFSLDSFVIF